MNNNSSNYIHVLPHSEKEKTHFLYSESVEVEELFEDKFDIEYHGAGIYYLEHKVLLVYKADDGLFVIESPIGDINYNPCEYEYDVFRYNDHGLVCKRSCINNECFIDIEQLL